MAFAIYCDASGGTTNAAKVISGYIATIEDWEQFNDAWENELARESVPYLHMTEIMHYRSAYTGWGAQPARRSKFLLRLASIVAEHMKCRFTSVVPMKAFNHVNSVYMLREGVDGPHALAARMVCKKAREWMNENHMDESWKVVFEKGDTDPDAKQGLLLERFEEDGLPSPSFEPAHQPNGEWVRPFEAADFAAWEFLYFRRMMDSDLIKSIADIRESFLGLSKLPHKDGMFEESDLITMCERAGVPLRQAGLSV